MIRKTTFGDLGLVGAMLALSACANISRMHEPAPQPAPMQPVLIQARSTAAPQPASDGSLWTPTAQQWFTDDKARQPGDILLVRVRQSNTGTKNANTDTSRDSSISARIRYLFGFEDKVNSVTGYSDNAAPGSAAWNPEPLVEASSNSQFSGSGETARSDTLEATVSAVVTEVLPNGNLVIYGNQTVTLNNEASVLTVQGIVRPTDIETNNVIDSQRIANADIRFTGSGVITDRQHPGWGMRAIDWIWPF